jgi:hypothetical protein
MQTMTNVHALTPCAICSTGMAIPGEPWCTTCDAVTLPALVPDGIGLLGLPPSRRPAATRSRPTQVTRSQ